MRCKHDVQLVSELVGTLCLRVSSDVSLSLLYLQQEEEVSCRGRRITVSHDEYSNRFLFYFRFGVKVVGANLAWPTPPIAAHPNAKEPATSCEFSLHSSSGNGGVIRRLTRASFPAGRSRSNTVSWYVCFSRGRNLTTRIRRSANRWLVPSVLGKWIGSSLTALLIRGHVVLSRCGSCPLL